MLDRDHKIRIVTSRLKGKARELKVMELCKDPFKLEAALASRMRIVYLKEMKK